MFIYQHLKYKGLRNSALVKGLVIAQAMIRLISLHVFKDS